MSVDQLQQGPKDPGAPAEINLFHVKRTAGRDAREVLPSVLAALLRGLAFPKRMSWDAWLEDGKGTFPFGRPIRWMVARQPSFCAASATPCAWLPADAALTPRFSAAAGRRAILL